METHATRVIALINDQRRAALEGFLAALQGDPPQVWGGRGEGKYQLRRIKISLDSLSSSHRLSEF